MTQENHPTDRETMTFTITVRHIAQDGYVHESNPIAHALRDIGYNNVHLWVAFYGGMVYVEYEGYQLDGPSTEWLKRYLSYQEVEPATLTMTKAGCRLMQPLKSLQEAQTYSDGIVVLQGDLGGMVYVVAPDQSVRCSAATLRTLLVDIDSIAWPERGYAELYYARLPIGEIVPGGMGGALMTNDIWIHPEFTAKEELAAAIRAVIEGRQERI